MYKKFLLPVLLTLFTVATGTCEHASMACTPPDDPPPKVAHYVIGNWNHVMDPRGCVLLDENNQLKIKAIITLGDNDMSQFKPMHVYTHFTDTDPYTSPAIETSDLDSMFLLNGQMVYTYTFEAYVGDFSDYCSEATGEPFPFDYEITPVDENGDPYPIELYPDLLWAVGTPNPGMDNSNIIYDGSSYSGTKDLCCYGASVEERSRDLIQNTDENIESNNKINLQEAKVFPNPFSEILNVKFQLKTNEVTTIQLWDIDGRLVHQHKHIPGSTRLQEAQISTINLENGFYYCRIKSKTESKTFKVLKLLR